LTTAKFFSPNGQPISQRGVQPDVLVSSAAKPDLDAGGTIQSDDDPVLRAGLQQARSQVSQR
jgi:C-terminal processing protease CtpA/Prc